MRQVWLLAAMAFFGSSVLGGSAGEPVKSTAFPDERALQAMTARFAPVALRSDLSGLPESERAALVKLIDAARVMDALFLRQVWSGNETLLRELVEDESALGRARLRYFVINAGPWSRLDDDAPFLPGVPAKPPEANFYPAGASKEDVEHWVGTLTSEARSDALGFFTTLRRNADGGFVSVPYSLEYQGELARAAQALQEAAALTSEPSLRSYLTSRAAAFVSNDYYASDVAWMEIVGAIEPTIGPYEVYEDEWFNAKAAFEAFITVRDEQETARLARFAAQLQDIEDHLPIDPGLRNPKVPPLAPIRVVDLIFGAGDGNRGVQTAAFNLPNDERIVAEKGAKRVMLRNVQEAKFEKVLRPIARLALPSEAQAGVAFEAFFTHILMHELMHGLGPHQITIDGRATTVRAELGEHYSAWEEAKADASGLWALQYLIDKGVVERSLERTLYATFLASTFRSIRFGLNSAHGKGIALQIGFLMDRQAIRVASDGTFSVDQARIKDAVRALTSMLLTTQARGDRRFAAERLAQAVVRPEVQRILDRLGDVPIDIAPEFVTARELAAR